jgi:nucleotide-binding universal stress UspA family protein
VYKRALVPLDGSPLAEAIIPFLVDIAGPLDMSVVLLRVLEPIPPVVVEGVRHALLETGAARARQAEEYLESTAATLRARGVEVSCQVRSGRPELEIVEAARDTSADLIAMSTHGRSGFGRLLFGSVAEQVLRHADVPVFMMRQSEGAAPATVTALGGADADTRRRAT